MHQLINKKLFIFMVIMISLTAITVSATDDFSKWDKKTYTEPQVKNGMIVIKSAENFAWILKNNINASQIKLECNIDMNNASFSSVPSCIKSFNGNGKIIKNLKINDTGLFGDSTGIDVFNLTLINIKVQSNYHAGILVGKLMGDSSFKNIIVKDSTSVAKNGHAGGFIGFVVRNNEKNRNEKLNIHVRNCILKTSNVTGSASEGKFIGCFSGYDKSEVVIFSQCDAASVSLADFTSTYITENQSCFNVPMSNQCNAFIGSTKYYRGVVSFNGVIFNHKWDGKTFIEPLLAKKRYDGNVKEGKMRYVIYSPFDLAGVRNTTAEPNAIYLKSSIDMNGQGLDKKYNVPSVFGKSKQSSKDDNNFKPFKTIAHFDGGGYTIYNLSIYQSESTSGAFILLASGKTVHKNITFDNCQTVVTHKPVKTNATAHGAILIADAGGSDYKMENIIAQNCRVFALQKVGMLAGYLYATKNTVSNCIVKNCYIENYKCNISETFDSGNKTFKNRTVRVTASFYPQGEVGGMFGFVQNAATITNCHVKKTKIHAYGQSDKMATITGSRLGKTALIAAGFYQVPGRHVSTFIGDIRTTKTVTISNCTVDTQSKCTNTWDKHNSTYNYIGRAYYVQFLDADSGAVKINNNKLTLANCNKYTTR